MESGDVICEDGQRYTVSGSTRFESHIEGLKAG
jgi:hypothetical protein